MIMFGCARSIFARSTCAPSGNSPAFIRRSRSRFSSTLRSRYGPGFPASVTVPRSSRISSSVCESTYAFPALHQTLGDLIQLVEVVARVPLFRPLEAEPFDVAS